MRLLLFSNSTNRGEEYLSYTLPFIDSFLGKNERQALFIPFAGVSIGYDAYFEMVKKQFTRIAIRLTPLHRVKNKKEAVKETQIIITGGGNTFYLLKSLQEEKLIQLIAEQALNGIPYIGWSAGSNLVCPTIRTTNDMPIVQPESLDALNLIPFQINPHYTDYQHPGHAGETREMRLQEFILTNRNMYVAGLREGTLLRIENNNIELLGKKSCRIFRYGQNPTEINPGEKLNFLMQ